MLVIVDVVVVPVVIVVDAVVVGVVAVVEYVVEPKSKHKIMTKNRRKYNI